MLLIMITIFGDLVLEMVVHWFHLIKNSIYMVVLMQFNRKI